jgi:hypothetical protein
MPIDYIQQSGSWRFHSSAIPRQAVNLQVFKDLFSTGDYIRLWCSTHGYDVYRSVQYSYARLLNFEADCDKDGNPITYLNLQLLVHADQIPNYSPAAPPSPHISYPRELVWFLLRHPTATPPMRTDSKNRKRTRITLQDDAKQLKKIKITRFFY